MGIYKSQPNYTLDVSGNVNANNINLQNLSNPSTTIWINSETSYYNSKLILGPGYTGINPANSFTDVSTCQTITKRNNLYIDAAVGKTMNINCESDTWLHYGDLSANNLLANTVSATSFIDNSVRITNKYVNIYGLSFLPSTSVALVNTPCFKFDINLHNCTNIIIFF